MPVKVARLARYSTKYEVTLEHDGRTYLVGYTGRQSKQGLLDRMHAAGPAILRITAMPDDATVRMVDAISGHARTFALVFSQGSRIRFSGRTQRDAILAGELPFVGKE